LLFILLCITLIKGHAHSSKS